jgi:hypothetical protein
MGVAPTFDKARVSSTGCYATSPLYKASVWSATPVREMRSNPPRTQPRIVEDRDITLTAISERTAHRCRAANFNSDELRWRVTIVDDAVDERLGAHHIITDHPGGLLPGRQQRLARPLRTGQRRGNGHKEKVARMVVEIRIPALGIAIVQNRDIVIGKDQLVKGRLLDRGIVRSPRSGAAIVGIEAVSAKGISHLMPDKGVTRSAISAPHPFEHARPGLAVADHQAVTI